MRVQILLASFVALALTSFPVAVLADATCSSQADFHPVPVMMDCGNGLVHKPEMVLVNAATGQPVLGSDRHCTPIQQDAKSANGTTSCGAHPGTMLTTSAGHGASSCLSVGGKNSSTTLAQLPPQILAPSRPLVSECMDNPLRP